MKLKDRPAHTIIGCIDQHTKSHLSEFWFFSFASSPVPLPPPMGNGSSILQEYLYARVAIILLSFYSGPSARNSLPLHIRNAMPFSFFNLGAVQSAAPGNWERRIFFFYSKLCAFPPPLFIVCLFVMFEALDKEPTTFRLLGDVEEGSSLNWPRFQPTM